MPNDQDGQEAVIRLLADPSTHGGQSVDRVDTHISHLFLVGERVFKLKRSVKTNFLDFTTADRREAACRREIEVNGRAAKDLYLGVVPITRRDGGLELGGDGTPVDWVVEMKRFDRSTEFDRLAENGELSLSLVETLGDAVARMHCAAPWTPEFGGADSVLATIAQIAEAIGEAPGARPAADGVATWRAEAEQRLERHRRQLDLRRRHGRVRRCHGDLHLGNICLHDGRPTPFDALEFDEEMASTDVLYDVAFTVMDLRERGLRRRALAFLNRYLAATRDYSGVSLLPLFVSMRAAVRSLVAASREKPDPHEPDAGERLDFAIAALAEQPPPALVAIGGLSGSGKSTVALRVAPRIGAGAIVLRSDVARKHMFGVAPEDRLPEEAYRPETSMRLYRQVQRDAGRALRAGATVIVDATFLSTKERDRTEAVADRLGVPFTGIWLECSPDELRRRVGSRTGDVSDADLSVLMAQLGRDPGPGSWISVLADGSIDETVAAVLTTLDVD